ncbi:hypothetical protein [Altererythrobacter sp. ZODW24]|uniref:hypothetical protein n=1 Tax=Altererythrobacter sp. ZODW24 TaxID=2185142 RepID=UPI000DF76A65|nr:hypothetical protein [Altererythrobacter sp. ZODW24]
MKPAKLIGVAATAFLAVLTLGLANLWHDRAYLPYGPNGQYFDSASGVSYSAGAVLAYGALVVIWGAATLFSAGWTARDWLKKGRTE